MIAVTAAKDVDLLRAAMQGGVIHYIVKPFPFDTFRERLEPVRGAQQRLRRSRGRARPTSTAYSLLRSSGRGALPKGHLGPTLTLVVDAGARPPKRSTARASPTAPASAAAPPDGTSSTSGARVGRAQSATAPPAGRSTCTAG